VKNHKTVDLFGKMVIGNGFLIRFTQTLKLTIAE